MKVLTRWNDKATYVIIIITILLCFITSLIIWGWSLIEYYNFWNIVADCARAQDFNCLLLEVSQEQGLFNYLKEITAFNLSIIGLFITTSCVSLYKFKFER